MPDNDLDFSNASVDSEHPMNSTGASLGNALKAGALTGAHIVGMPAEAAINLGQAAGSVVQDTANNVTGNWTVPGSGLYHNDQESRQRIMNKSLLAKAQGDDKTAKFHELMSNIPVAGPLVDNLGSDLYKGATEHDPEAWGRGMGGILSMVMPTIKGPLAESANSGGSVAGLQKGLIKSSADNYFSTFNLPDTVEGQSIVPKAERTAQQIAEGPAPIAMSRGSLKDQFAAGKAATGGIPDSVLGNSTSDAEALVRHLADYGRNNYAVKNAQGVPIPTIKGKIGIPMLDELVDDIQRNSTPKSGTPGLVGPGQSVPASNGSEITNKAINGLRRDLEAGTVSRKGNWADNIDPKSLEKLDRNHAGMLRDWMDNNAPDIKTGNSIYSMYATGHKLLQDAYNKSRTGSGLPMPGLNLPSGKLSMPKFIQDSFVGVPWNTVSGATKSALAKSLSKSDWGNAQHIMQFAKLGVPYNEEQNQ